MIGERRPPADCRGADTVTVTTRPSSTAADARHAGEPKVGQLVEDISKNLSTLLHSEIELAKLELKVSVKNAGVGVGFFGAALVLLVFSLTFGLIALAEGIHAMGLYRWLSYLIVFLLLLIVVGLLVWRGLKKVKRVKAPARTIATSKDTVAYLKANSKRR
ncbi:MAG: phage holin family protein [Pseudonocardiales bacterium]|nr:MAG: phage holin family protein [Pseudonocardiales bacterium]